MLKICSSSIIVLIAYKIFTKKAKKLVDKAMYPLYTKQVGCESSYNGILAQLGEHLPYKQRVIGSSPIGSIPTSVGHMAR